MAQTLRVFIFTAALILVFRVINYSTPILISKDELVKSKKSYHLRQNNLHIPVHMHDKLRHHVVALDHGIGNRLTHQPYDDMSISGWLGYSKDSVDNEETDNVTEIEVITQEETISNWRGVHPDLYKMAPEV